MEQKDKLKMAKNMQEGSIPFSEYGIKWFHIHSELYGDFYIVEDSIYGLAFHKNHLGIYFAGDCLTLTVDLNITKDEMKDVKSRLAATYGLPYEEEK